MTERSLPYCHFPLTEFTLQLHPPKYLNQSIKKLLQENMGQNIPQSACCIVGEWDTSGCQFPLSYHALQVVAPQFPMRWSISSLKVFTNDLSKSAVVVTSNSKSWKNNSLLESAVRRINWANILQLIFYVTGEFPSNVNIDSSQLTHQIIGLINSFRLLKRR